MLRPSKHATRSAYTFGVAGLLAGIIWISAPDEWGPPWIWTLGLLFSATTLLAASLESLRLPPQKIEPGDAIRAALILSAAWPIALLAFGAALTMMAKLDPSVSLTTSALAMFVGVLAASSCVWLALRALTKIWSLTILCYLFCSGAILVVLSAIVNATLSAHQFNAVAALPPPRLLLSLLVVPGSALYAYLFGLGFLRARNVRGAWPAGG